MTQLLRMKQVRQATSLSRSEIYRRLSRAEFPQPIKLGTRSVAWVDTEIQDFIDAAIKKSRGGA